MFIGKSTIHGPFSMAMLNDPTVSLNYIRLQYIPVHDMIATYILMIGECDITG